MKKVMGLNLALPPDYLNAAVIVSLLSVLVLIFLFLYLNWYTGRRYFSIWTLGWAFYAVWLGLGPGLTNGSPLLTMLKHWCVALSAALLFWGSVKFLELPSRPMLFCLFAGFLLVWSYLGAYYLSNPLQIGVPLFGVIGLASLVTAFSFYRLRKHREYIGAGLLTFGFILWGIYLGVCPFFAREKDLAGTGFLVSAVLQLFIAVSMIILVLEEARAANEMILNEIRGGPRMAGEPGIPKETPGVFDRSRLREKMRRAQADLQQEQAAILQQERLQALGQMSRGIAHDINNALTPILGYSNLLLREPQELPPTVVSYLRSIKAAGEKISQSVSCIRDFYRSQDGRDLLMALDLNVIAGEALEDSRSQRREAAKSEGAKADLRSEFGVELPQIMGKREDLREALGQLLANALEAMPEGGKLTVRTGLRAGASTRGEQSRQDEVFVEVSDTGVGMDEETRKHCLEPFFTTRQQQGAKGLGLSKVFGIVQRHRGQIEIESRKGRGTLVRLRFPAVRSSSTEMMFAGAGTAAVAPLKVLCIDDEPAVLDVLKILLKSGGHRVEVAGDGLSGLEAFRAARVAKEPFDVVLTDLGMPRMDGRRVAKEIKQESSGTPVILLTGWGGIMQAEGNHPEHIDVVLGKPPQVNELMAALQKAAG